MALSTATTIELTAILAAIAATVTAAELVALRADFSAGGLAAVEPWPDDRRPTFAGGLQVWLPTMAVVQAGLLVVISLTSRHPAAAIRIAAGAALIAVAILFTFVLSFGRDGADDMAFCVAVPLGIGAVAGAGADDLVLALVSLQLLLAVTAAGVAKLGGPAWRQGTAVVGIMTTETFAWPALAARLRTAPVPVQRALSYGVLAWELTLPVVVLLGGSNAATIVLAAGLLFHLGTAVFMRLNRLLLWFGAAYPAALWLAVHSPVAI